MDIEQHESDKHHLLPTDHILSVCNQSEECDPNETCHLIQSVISICIDNDDWRQILENPEHPANPKNIMANVVNPSESFNETLEPIYDDEEEQELATEMGNIQTYGDDEQLTFEGPVETPGNGAQDDFYEGSFFTGGNQTEDEEN